MTHVATLKPSTAVPLSAGVGERMYRLIRDLYPICRSITGDGVRATLQRVAEYVPLAMREVKTGTQVFDWTVPREWNIRDAYIKNSRGERVIDFRQSNLHVVSYSVPVLKTLSLAELKPHLHSLPDHPDWIPYRTSYYNESWGFCLSHRQLLAMPEDDYEVCIDSTLVDGHLTYGEYFVKGASESEVLISCHVCHPSLCNDNLSGVALTTFLAQQLARQTGLRYSYRFLFIPGTIGSITWLAQNEASVPRIKHGLVVVCVGDGGHFTYKKSRQGNAEIDRAVQQVLSTTAANHEVIDFYPYGYDERQYCSPGFNLAVGSLSRTTHGRYPQYHTSADDLTLVQPEHLDESLEKYLAVVSVLEHNRRYRNLNPKCEPQLGKRGLYRAIGANAGKSANEMALLWVLNLSDGDHSLLDIAERSGIAFEYVHDAAEALRDSGLIEELA